MSQIAADPRPKSAVSTGVGVAGLVGLIAWILLARAINHGALNLVLFGERIEASGPNAALCAAIACGFPMVLWSLLVDRVHRNPSTGLDWDSAPRPLRDSMDVSLTKLAGLWATWGLIALIYCTARWYWQGNYIFAMDLFERGAPFLFVLSIPYVLWIDRILKEPRDGAWHLGQWLIGGGDAAAVDREEIFNHLRSWAVKGFFLAFMLSIVPFGFHDVVTAPAGEILQNPVTLTRYLMTAMFVVDVMFATVGYMLTMKPLDAHIRSANPYAAGWTAALICYPPFIMMGDNGPLDYHPGTAEWAYWLEGQYVLTTIVGALLVALTAIYAWATVAFGMRFSNLTHRGILTHGPYSWTKHPAYLSKNTFWWLSTLPFLATTNSLSDAVRNTLLMAVVTGVYYWRARTEERHLGADPAYAAYAEWMERNAPVPRFFRWVRGAGRPRPQVAPAE